MISESYNQYLELEKHKAAIANIRAFLEVGTGISKVAAEAGVRKKKSDISKGYIKALIDVNKMIDRIL